MLAPPSGEDLDWIKAEATKPELLASFGLDSDDDRLAMATDNPNVNTAVVLVEGQKRVGFALLFPPRDPDVFWEYLAAIPSVSDRDGYTTMQAFDAMAFYAFDWMKIERLGFRIEERNTGPQALAKRAGFTPLRTEVVEGKKMIVYSIDRATWNVRLANLEKGELAHPSGLGATFLRVGPPFIVRQTARAPGPLRA